MNPPWPICGSAEADNVKAQADLARYKQLIAKDEISKQQYDQAEAAAQSAARTWTRNARPRKRMPGISKRLRPVWNSRRRGRTEAERNRPQQIAIQNATVAEPSGDCRASADAVDQAVLNLSYTKIIAPMDGMIGKKNAEPGQQVAPGQQLMARRAGEQHLGDGEFQRDAVEAHASESARDHSRRFIRPGL